VAVGSDTTPAKTIQYSLDGSKWYPSFMALIADPEPSKVGSFKDAGYSVVWAENYFIAVGTDSVRPSRKIIYSADGKNWLSYDVTGNENLLSANGICYSRGSTGPLYALTIKGDAYIDGNLYITNGYPVSVNAITGSSGGASGAAGASGAGGSGSGGASAGPAPLRFVTDVSTMLAQFSSIGVGVKDPGYEIDVAGSINASSNIYINGVNVTTENSLASTIEGLGSFKYISSLSLQSTVQSFMTNCSSLQANFSSIGVNCNSPNYDIDVIGDINYTGTLYNNGVVFAGSGSIPGINSIGSISINKTGVATAELDVDGSAIITGDSAFNNNLYVGGKLTVNSNINVGGVPVTNNAVTTLAGSGLDTPFANAEGAAATFNYPRGLAIAPDGTIYVADEYNRRIRKITPGGVVTTLAGSGTQAYTDGIGAAASFKSPRGLSVGPDGNIYVADTESHVIRKVTPGGVVTTLAGGGTQSFADGTGTSALFNWPYDVSVAHDGNIYVADTHNNRIRKITPQGVVTTIAGRATETPFADGTGAAASFNMPHALEVGPDGIIYVADTNNNRIRKVTTTGVVTTLAGQATAGTSDATGASASFDKPRGIDIDKDGNVYVGDTDNHRIRKITPGGVVTTLTGSSSGANDGRINNATFNLPWSVAIGPDGNIYVADTGNHKIRKIDSGSSSLNMTGNAYFTNFITAGGNVNVNGELDVSGNTNLRGTVSFGGNIITTMNSFSVKDSLGNFLINASNWAGSNTTAISHSVGNRGIFTHFYSPVTHSGLNTDSYQLFWYPSAGQGGQGSTGTVFGLWDLNPVQNYWKIDLPVNIRTKLDVTNGISIGGSALSDGTTTYNLSIPDFPILIFSVVTIL
jgi:glucose/arabinose dehydrogenase